MTSPGRGIMIMGAIYNLTLALGTTPPSVGSETTFNRIHIYTSGVLAWVGYK